MMDTHGGAGVHGRETGGRRKDITLLFVEDELNDVFFVRRALRHLDPTYHVQTVRNGEYAVNYLSGTGHYRNRQHYPLPAMVLLDLNPPVTRNFKLLEWIHQQPQSQSLPAVVFSASALEADRKQAMRLGASDYFVKPKDTSGVSDLLASVRSRFLRHDPAGGEAG
ncbi:MAG: response regulator [Verrucomicrobia bacterium]|nr:response regulator [Verrucomicrobiota bacterium]